MRALRWGILPPHTPLFSRPHTPTPLFPVAVYIRLLLRFTHLELERDATHGAALDALHKVTAKGEDFGREEQSSAL